MNLCQAMKLICKAVTWIWLINSLMCQGVLCQAIIMVKMDRDKMWISQFSLWNVIKSNISVRHVVRGLHVRVAWRSMKEYIQGRIYSDVTDVARDSQERAIFRDMRGYIAERNLSNVTNVARDLQEKAVLRDMRGYIAERNLSNVTNVARDLHKRCILKHIKEHI